MLNKLTANMKTRNLYGAAALATLAALTLASCSQEEVMSVRQDGIAYNVLAKNQTRAADSYCNKILPGSFKVWAQADGDLYIDGDLIANEGGQWIDKNGTRYWPDGSTLNFFAEVNGNNVFDYNGGAPKFNSFRVNDEVPEQLDLMYAVQPNQTRNGSPVNLNFRHALSQVCFRAQNNSQNLNVEIKSITVGHLYNQGTYQFPTESTEENYTHPNHNDGIDDDAPILNCGQWTLEGTDGNSYTANVNPDSNGDETSTTVMLTPGSSKNLTCPEGSSSNPHENGFTNVMTLMPQQVKAWNPQAGSYDGAYFKLDVVMTDKDSNKVLHTDKAVVPVEIDWEQGYRYIYTFIFNEGGNGGWTDDPENPEPVLGEITYKVSVDDFIPVVPGNGNTEMDTNNDGKLPGENDDPVITDVTLSIPALNWSETAQVEDDAVHTFTIPTDVVTPEDEYYEFQGWSTTPNASVAEYQPNGTIDLSANNANVTLYPVIVKVYHDVTLSFDVNGETAIEPMTIKKVKIGEEATFEKLPAVVETADESYALEGWMTHAPEKKILAYEDETPAEMMNPGLRNYKAKESHTLYAIYRATESVVGGGGYDPNIK